MNLQLFAEKDIIKQTDKSLIRGIESLKGMIALHENKIKHPERYDSNWSTYSELKKAGTIRHWQKEMSTFEESIKNREEELKKRGRSQ